METKNKVWLLTLTTNVNAEKILHVDEEFGFPLH